MCLHDVSTVHDVDEPCHLMSPVIDLCGQGTKVCSPRHRFTLPPQNFNWRCDEVSDQQLLASTTAPDVKVAAGGRFEPAGISLQLATAEVPRCCMLAESRNCRPATRAAVCWPSLLLPTQRPGHAFRCEGGQHPAFQPGAHCGLLQ